MEHKNDWGSCVSHLKNLLAQAKTRDPQLGADLERECNALLEKTRFGLQFERHRPEAVELPNRMPRKGDKVRVLPERGSTQRTDPALWLVKRIVKDGAAKRAEIELIETPPASSVQRPASSVQRPASSVRA